MQHIRARVVHTFGSTYSRNIRRLLFMDCGQAADKKLAKLKLHTVILSVRRLSTKDYAVTRIILVGASFVTNYFTTLIFNPSEAKNTYRVFHILAGSASFPNLHRFHNSVLLTSRAPSPWQTGELKPLVSMG